MISFSTRIFTKTKCQVSLVVKNSIHAAVLDLRFIDLVSANVITKRLPKPEDHRSCIAHLIAEDVFKSAVIEEKKFKNIECK